MKIGIYQIRNLINNKVYIGSSKNIQKRFITHKRLLRKNKSPHVALQRAWNKYGEDNFLFEIIKECSIENLFKEEKLHIDKISLKMKYNTGTVGGGDNTSMHINNKEIRIKISNAVKSRYLNMSAQEKEQISNKMKGKGNPNYNNKWNKIQKEKLSRKQKERFIKNPNLRNKISDTMKIQWNNKTKEEREIFKNNCRERSKGSNNPFFGSSHSLESKNKISEKQKERFAKMSDIEKANSIPNSRKISVNGVVYYSINSAAKHLGISSKLLWYRLKSKLSKYSQYFYID